MSSSLLTASRRHARRLCAAGIVLGLLLATRLTDRSSVEAASDISLRFRFKRTSLLLAPIHRWKHTKASRGFQEKTGGN